MKRFEPTIGDPDNPLVSVLIYNYNYGRYLQQCLESVIAQTYANVDIVFSDNASSDESWDIAHAFEKQYPGRISINKNAVNIGPDLNFERCIKTARGDYLVPLASDDVLLPTFIASCVQAFKSNPPIGYVMTHCAVIDADGQRTDEPPFYNRSCVINGHDQAAVYMMAAVNPSMSQIMYNRLKMMEMRSSIGSVAHRWYGMRMLDFNLCIKYPMAYIKEPLVLFRIHGKNDSLLAGEDLLEVIGPYILVKQFYETAQVLNLTRITERLEAATAKLAVLALRYCVRHLCCGNAVAGKRYFHLAPALLPAIVDNPVYLALERYWHADEAQQATILDELYRTQNLLARSVSYDPPAGSIDLHLTED